MAQTRSVLIAGPAKCIYTPAAGATTFFSKEDFAVNIRRETFLVGPNGIAADERESDILVEAEIIPDGRLAAAQIAAFWPHLNKLAGAGLFADTDYGLVLHSSDAALMTIPSVAVTRMPDLTFSAVQSMIGPIGFTGLRKSNVPWSTAASLYTYAATGGTFTDATWTGTSIKTQQYTGVLATSTGFTSAWDTFDGFRVAFNLNLDNEVVDAYGTHQIRYQSVDVVVTCIPIGPTIANVEAELAVDGTGAARGRSVTALGTQLTIVGADSVTYFTMPNCTMKTHSYRFGSRAGFLRQGEVAFVGRHSFSSGVQQAICTIAAS